MVADLSLLCNLWDWTFQSAWRLNCNSTHISQNQGAMWNPEMESYNFQKLHALQQKWLFGLHEQCDAHNATVSLATTKILMLNILERLPTSKAPKENVE